MKLKNDTAQMFIEFIEKSNSETIKELKNIVIRRQQFELGAGLRDFEKHKISQEEIREEIKHDVIIDTKTFNISLSTIEDAYMTVMKYTGLQKEDIDNLPFHTFKTIYDTCKSKK